MSNITSQMKTGQVNTFTGGINTDLNPILQPKDTLTDCVNGTIITYNSNENMLQNDMGNYKLKNAKLPEGYIPLGMKEYGGIIYLALGNPNTGKIQLGSYPSPQTKSDEIYDDELKDDTLYEISPININTIDKESIKTFDFFSKEAEQYFYSNLDTNNSSVIFTSNFKDDSTFEVGDKFAIGVDNIESNPAYQELKYFSINNEKTKYSLDEKLLNIEQIPDIESYDKDDAYLKQVSWQFPGWIGCEYVIETPISHVQDVNAELKQISNEERIFDTIEKNEENNYILKEFTYSEGMISLAESFKTIPTNEIWLELPLGKENLVIDNLDEYNIESISDSNYFVEIKFKSPVYSIEFLEDVIQGVADKIIVPSTILVIPENIPTYMLFVNHHIIKTPGNFKYVKRLYTTKEIDDSFFKNNIVYLTDTDEPLLEMYSETEYVNGRGIITKSGDSDFLHFNKELSPKLKSVVFDSACKKIESNWFNDYEFIEYVNGTNVSEIDENAFNNCINLKEVVFGNLENIKNYAFKGCEKIRYFKLENSNNFINIGINCFEKCTGTLYLNSDYKVFTNINVWSLNSFYGSKFKKLIIGNNIKVIHPYTFCYSLSDSTIIQFGLNVETIDEFAFFNSQISNIELFSKVELKKRCFYNCKYLTDATFHDSVILNVECLYSDTLRYITFFKGSTFNVEENKTVIKSDRLSCTIKFYGTTNFTNTYCSNYNIFPFIIWWYSKSIYLNFMDLRNVIYYVGNPDLFSSFSNSPVHNISKDLEIVFNGMNGSTTWLANGGAKWIQDNNFEINQQLADSIKIGIPYSKSLKDLEICWDSRLNFDIKKIIVPDTTFTSKLWSQIGINKIIQEVEIKGNIEGEIINISQFRGSWIKNLTLFDIQTLVLDEIIRCTNLILPETLENIKIYNMLINSKPALLNNVYLQSDIKFKNDEDIELSLEWLNDFVSGSVNILDSVYSGNFTPFSIINFDYLSIFWASSIKKVEQLLKDNDFIIKSQTRIKKHGYRFSIFTQEDPVYNKQGNLFYTGDLSDLKWISIPDKINQVDFPKIGCKSLCIPNGCIYHPDEFGSIEYLYIWSGLSWDDTKYTGDVFHDTSEKTYQDHLKETAKIKLNGDICQIINVVNDKSIVISGTNSNLNTVEFIKYAHIKYLLENNTKRIYSIENFNKLYEFENLSLEPGLSVELPSSSDTKFEINISGKNIIKIPKIKYFKNLKLYVKSNYLNEEKVLNSKLTSFENYDQMEFEYSIFITTNKLEKNVIIQSVPYLYNDSELLIFDNHVTNDSILTNLENTESKLIEYKYYKFNSNLWNVELKFKTLLNGEGITYNFYKLESQSEKKLYSKYIYKNSSEFKLENIELDDNSIYIFEIINSSNNERIRRFLLTYPLKTDNVSDVSDYSNLYFDDFDTSDSDSELIEDLFTYEWINDSKLKSTASCGDAHLTIDSDKVFHSLVCNNLSSDNSPVKWEKSQNRSLIIKGTEKFKTLADSSDVKLKYSISCTDGTIIQENKDFTINEEINVVEKSTTATLEHVENKSVPVRKYLIKGAAIPETIYDGQSDATSISNNRFGWSEKLFEYAGLNGNEIDSGSHILIEKCGGGKEIEMSYVKHGEQSPKTICSYETDVESVINESVNKKQLFIPFISKTKSKKSGFSIPVPLKEKNKYRRKYPIGGDDLDSKNKWESQTMIFNKGYDKWKTILTGVALAAGIILSIVTLGAGTLIAAGVISATLGTFLTGVAIGWGAVAAYIGLDFAILSAFKEDGGLTYENYGVKTKIGSNTRLVLPMWGLQENHPWYFIENESKYDVDAIISRLYTHLYYYDGETSIWTLNDCKTKISKSIKIDIEINGTKLVNGKPLSAWDNDSYTLINTETNNFKCRNNDVETKHSLIELDLNDSTFDLVKEIEDSNRLLATVPPNSDNGVYIDFENCDQRIQNFVKQIYYNNDELYYQLDSEIPSKGKCFLGNRGDYKLHVVWEDKDIKLLKNAYKTINKDGYCPIAYPIDPTNESLLTTKHTELSEFLSDDVPEYLTYLINYDKI